MSQGGEGGISGGICGLRLLSGNWLRAQHCLYNNGHPAACLHFPHHWQVGVVVLGTNAIACLALLASASALGWQMWTIALVCAGISFGYNAWALGLKPWVVAGRAPRRLEPGGSTPGNPGIVDFEQVCLGVVLKEELVRMLAVLSFAGPAYLELAVLGCQKCYLSCTASEKLFLFSHGMLCQPPRHLHFFY